ncbi:MAG: hypothetical protein ACRD2J_12305, partial [Thermoanaerobaculia bacterium]
AAARAVASRTRAAALATLILVTTAIAAAAVAVPRTWARAPEALRQFRIRLPAAYEAGPLLDARGLLAEEARFLRRRGRDAEAAETERLLEKIDGRLADLAAASPPVNR